MPTDIAALVGSRICHDLISPIGAIGNGVELLGLIDSKNGAEMDLISESVEHANARIRFFRIAFGAASTSQLVGRSEVQSILTDMSKSGRITYFWDVDQDQPRSIVRCVFLMLQCLEVALPMGGNVDIKRSNGSWSLKAAGPRLTIDEPLWDSLTDPDNGVEHTAAQVQFALLPALMAQDALNLHIDQQPTHIMVRF